jgi:Ran GTPase-activating protein (RanGAP) involved in mRNA processing and transport
MLGTNFLGCKGAMNIGRGLASPNATLKKLDLSRNCLGGDGADAVAEGLHAAEGLECSLIHLDLSCNKIDADGAESLGATLGGGGGGSRLQVLDLSGNHLGCDGAALLALGIESALQSAVDKVPGLQELLLAECRIGAAGAAAIASVLCAPSRVATLSLANNPKIGGQAGRARCLVRQMPCGWILSALDLS